MCRILVSAFSLVAHRRFGLTRHTDHEPYLSLWCSNMTFSNVSITTSLLHSITFVIGFSEIVCGVYNVNYIKVQNINVGARQYVRVRCITGILYSAAMWQEFTSSKDAACRTANVWITTVIT